MKAVFSKSAQDAAFIKSMRGSDPDAALYWLGLMLEAGEDIRFIGRRLVIAASEEMCIRDRGRGDCGLLRHIGWFVE